jgi:hypothetical protein
MLCYVASPSHSDDNSVMFSKHGRGVGEQCTGQQCSAVQGRAGQWSVGGAEWVRYLVAA